MAATLRECDRLVPAYPKVASRLNGVHRITISRWIGRGVRASDGRLIRLPVTKLNGRFFARESAIDEFLAKVELVVRTKAEVRA
jgi:hypothetical protein